MIYGEIGMLNNAKATCYPGYEKSFKKNYIKDRSVVVDKNFITADGPASAIEFALTAVAHLGSRTKAEETAKEILYKGKIG
ncbi:MAG: DJ-1/PfpI family protein [Sphaerochaetaceae bacterium]|nr:DJ-1/PfpI family protein [Sphaerochaetaceae bacterium]